MQHVRPQLDEWGAVPASALATIEDRSRGARRRARHPPAAAADRGGVVFINLEDETGMVNVVCPRQAWERQRRIALNSSALLVDGRLERNEGAINLLVLRLRPLRVVNGTPRSRDFR